MIRFSAAQSRQSGPVSSSGGRFRRWAGRMLVGTALATGGFHAGYFWERIAPRPIVSVSDGDTVRVGKLYGKSDRIRLWGIDAKETGQPYGKETKKQVKDLLEGDYVWLSCEKNRDGYGRKVCTLYQLWGEDVNKRLVRDGLAYSEPDLSHDPYRRAEETAKREKRGFWGALRPDGGEKPWHWRKKRS